MVIIKFVANHFPLNDSHLSPYKLLAETKLISICLRRRENEVTGKKAMEKQTGGWGYYKVIKDVGILQRQ